MRFRACIAACKPHNWVCRLIQAAIAPRNSTLCHIFYRYAAHLLVRPARRVTLHIHVKNALPVTNNVGLVMFERSPETVSLGA